MTLVFVLLVLFFATLVKSAVGFGDGLIAMPLLAWLIGLESAGALVAVVLFFSGALIVIRDWKEINWRAVMFLLLSAIPFVPLGIIMVAYGDIRVAKSILGTLLILFSTYNLAGWKIGKLENDRWAWIFGAVAGFLEGAYNTAGPPIVIYGALREWPIAMFRASLQGFFTITILIVIISHALIQHYTPVVLNYCLFSIPILIAAVFAGRWLNRKITNPSLFRKLVYLMLIGLGVGLFF